MLLLLRVLGEHLVAVLDRAVDLAAAQLSLEVDNLVLLIQLLPLLSSEIELMDEFGIVAELLVNADFHKVVLVEL